METLKYLPITLMCTLQGRGLYTYTFVEPITLYTQDNIKKMWDYHARRLVLKIQRKYRKEIRETGKNIEEFILLIYEDITAVTDGIYGTYLTCTLELMSKDRWMLK